MAAKNKPHEATTAMISKLAETRPGRKYLRESIETWREEAELCEATARELHQMANHAKDSIDKAQDQNQDDD